MRYWKKCVTGCIFTAILAGCHALPDFEAAFSLDTITQRRIERYGEWRDCRQAPPGTPVIIHLGSANNTSVLRLGIIEGEPHGQTARIRVYAGDTLIHRFTTGRDPRWRDYRISLSRVDREVPCRLVIDSSQPVWLGPCELIQPDTGKPNILIFLIDALRLDRVGRSGSSKPTTPHIDRLAQDGVTFTQLMPQSSWTKPSIASLFTSTYPGFHAAQDRPDVLRPGLPSLARALAHRGYETQGFIPNANILPLWGFGHDFNRYADVDASDFDRCDDAKVVDRCIDAIRHAQGRPWFFYVHTMGPHEPYDPPDEYARRFPPALPGDEREEIKARYDGEIAYSDAQFGRLIAALHESDQYENTLIILLSDHGEEFWEHGGLGHGTTLYEEVLRVPLIQKWPAGRWAGEWREELVEMVDLAPTILDYLDLPPEEAFQGRSFLPLLKQKPWEESPGFATLVNLAESWRCAKTSKRKFLRDAARREKTWYDLKTDPAEQAPYTSTPEGWDDLAMHAATTAVRGAYGLHLLMTCGDEERVVEGVIRASDLGAHDLRYYPWKSEITRETSELSFHLWTHHPSDQAFERDVWHREVAEQDNAHLRVALDADSSFSIEILVDGETIDPEWISWGAPDVKAPDKWEQVNPLDGLADSDDFDPAGLPRRFALYLWYVPETDTLNLERIDPRLQKTLETLGYL